jgi:hypothetical protein
MSGLAHPVTLGPFGGRQMARAKSFDEVIELLFILNRHSPDKCRLKTTLRLFVVIGKPGSDTFAKSVGTFRSRAER